MAVPHLVYKRGERMADIRKVKTVFQIRRSTTAEWEANKDAIPDAGEPCFDLDFGILKIGDGKTAYKDLKIIGAGASISDDGLYLIVDNLQKDIDELKIRIENISVEDQINDAMSDIVDDSELQQTLDSVLNN